MMRPDDNAVIGGDERGTRRAFLRAATSGVVGVLALDLGWPAGAAAPAVPLRLEPSGLTGGCARVDGPAIIPGALWYEAQRENDGLVFRFAPGALAGMRFLTADIFADCPELPVFQLRLGEGEDGPMFTLTYAVLPHAEARMRMQGGRDQPEPVAVPPRGCDARADGAHGRELSTGWRRAPPR
jgi:hypothetical protein